MGVYIDNHGLVPAAKGASSLPPGLFKVKLDQRRRQAVWRRAGRPLRRCGVGLSSRQERRGKLSLPISMFLI